MQNLGTHVYAARRSRPRRIFTSPYILVRLSNARLFVGLWRRLALYEIPADAFNKTSRRRDRPSSNGNVHASCKESCIGARRGDREDRVRL